MQWIKINIDEDSDSRDLLFTTSRNLVFTVGMLYLIWHFVATLFLSDIFSPSIWLITIVFFSITALTLHLLERNYLLAHLIWQIGLATSITLAYQLYLHPEITIAFIFLPLMAIVTIGPWGSMLVEMLVASIILLMQNGNLFPPLPGSYALGIILGSVFSGFFWLGAVQQFIICSFFRFLPLQPCP